MRRITKIALTLLASLIIFVANSYAQEYTDEPCVYVGSNQIAPVTMHWPPYMQVFSSEGRFVEYRIEYDYGCLPNCILTAFDSTIEPSFEYDFSIAHHFTIQDYHKHQIFTFPEIKATVYAVVHDRKTNDYIMKEHFRFTICVEDMLNSKNFMIGNCCA